MDTKQCTYCGEEILAAANECKHCEEWLENAATAIECSNPKVKKKHVSAIVVGAIAIAAFLSTALVFADDKMSDEQLRKAIVGRYYCTETDDSDEDVTITVSGIDVFNANGVYEFIGTIVISVFDDYDDMSTLKYQLEMSGKYEIENSYIIYDCKFEDIHITLIESDNRELSRYFNNHYIPLLKYDLMLDNIEKIIELTDRFLKTEIEDEGEKIITTYIRL